MSLSHPGWTIAKHPYAEDNLEITAAAGYMLPDKTQLHQELAWASTGFPGSVQGVDYCL